MPDPMHTPIPAMRDAVDQHFATARDRARMVVDNRGAVWDVSPEGTLKLIQLPISEKTPFEEYERNPAWVLEAKRASRDRPRQLELARQRAMNVAMGDDPNKGIIQEPTPTSTVTVE